MTETEHRIAIAVINADRARGRGRNPIFEKMTDFNPDNEPMPPNLRSILMAAAWERRHLLPADLQVFVAMKGGVGG